MFRVGDIVTGTTNRNGKYAYTTSEAVMEVEEIRNDGEDMVVKIIQHERLHSKIGARWTVEQRYFKLVKPKKVTNKGWS